MKYLYYLKVILITIVLAVMFNIPFAVYSWSEHTYWVQETVSKSFNKYKDKDIIWGSVDLTSNQQDLLYDVRIVIMHNLMLFHNDSFKDEHNNYINSLYDLIFILVNSPNDTDALNYHHKILIDNQTNFYNAIDKFIENHYYAMVYTFW